MHEILYDEEVIKFLRKQEKDLCRRIFEKIESTKENPHRFFKKLEARTDYSLRVGVYRIIADIDDSKKTINITLIGHRRNVYD